jgi:hypothetical protein
MLVFRLVVAFWGSLTSNAGLSLVWLESSWSYLVTEHVKLSCDFQPIYIHIEKCIRRNVFFERVDLFLAIFGGETASDRGDVMPAPS